MVWQQQNINKYPKRAKCKRDYGPECENENVRMNKEQRKPKNKTRCNDDVPINFGKKLV